MYEEAPVQRIVEQLAHIHDLCEGDGTSDNRDRMIFLRGLIHNLQHDSSRLSPRMLSELSQRIPLTIGGAFRLIGYRLDEMRKVDFLLNGHHTRIIESYPFYRDRLIHLPGTLSEDHSFLRNALVSEIVLGWQTDMRIRALQGPAWQRPDLFYVQLGMEDTLALSGLPPTTVLSIEPVPEEEQAKPDSDAIYCLQFGYGYRCCRCMVSHGRLSVLPHNSVAYAGKHEFLYPGEVRIAGRARAFSVGLLLLGRDEHFELPRGRGGAPLVLPWEQLSLNSLFKANRMRFGLPEQNWSEVEELLTKYTGAGLSLRTLRRYEHPTSEVPHTGTLINMTLVHAARMSDVLRLLRFWPDDSRHFSLTSWLETKSFEGLQANLRPAVVPEPRNRWAKLIKEWGEWPALLSMAIPDLQEFEDNLLRIYPSHEFDGLDPLICPGAVALLEDVAQVPTFSEERKLSDWERPIYALRHGGDLLCGFLDGDDDHIVLVPHSARGGKRLSFLRRQMEIIGRFRGIASPLRYDG